MAARSPSRSPASTSRFTSTPSAPTSANQMNRQRHQPAEHLGRSAVRRTASSPARRAYSRLPTRARGTAPAPFYPQRGRRLSTRSSRILKPWPVRWRASSSNSGRVLDEEPAHRVRQRRGQEHLGASSRCRHPTAHGASGWPVRCYRRPPRGGSRDGEVVGTPLQGLQHHRQPRLVMLQVAVDHRDECGGRCQPALDYRRSLQAAAADPPNAAHPPVDLADAAPLRPRCRPGCRRQRRSPPRRCRSARRPAWRSSARRSAAHYNRG